MELQLQIISPIGGEVGDCGMRPALCLVKYEAILGLQRKIEEDGGDIVDWHARLPLAVWMPC
jgi:hypothetical protein